MIDQHGVDGVFNGTAKTAMDIGGIARGWQTGRIRNYVLFAAGAATIVFVIVLIYGIRAASPVAAVAGAVG